MKPKTAILLLGIVCVVLGIVLIQTKKKASDQHKEDTAKLEAESNKVIETKKKLTEQEEVNKSLETDISKKTTEIQSLSNNLSRTSSDLSRTSSELVATTAKLKQTEAEAEAAAKAAAEKLAAAQREAQEAIAKRDAQIAQLQNNQDRLTQKMDSLNVNIASLEKNITETQRKLAASEGDREFLIKELKRLQTEKAELERQMHDLAFLREQVRELKSELSIARRLEWIRRGIFGAGEIKKGGQIMQEGFAKAAPGSGKYNLEVEVSSDGSVKVVSPGATNAPPKAPSPK
ncbi:MAG: hypothetical protein AB1813_22880 [Verrucomicrobiota bacterium]